MIKTGTIIGRAAPAILALLLLAGCSIPEYGILADEGGPSFPGREELLSSLPARRIIGEAELSEEVQAILRITFREVLPFGEIEADEIIVFREILLPAVDLHDPEERISSALLRDHFRKGTALPENISIVSLAESALPLRGLPVDDLYFDEPEYPLIRRIVMRLNEIPLKEPDSIPGRITAALTRRKRNEELRLQKEKISEWLEELQISSAAIEDRKFEIAWIASVGDIMPGRGVSSMLEQKDGVSKVFGSLLPLLRSNHITAGNFEGTLPAGRKAIPKSYNFSLPVSVLPRLHDAGFDYLTLTNNHIWDFGEGRFLDTLAAIADSALVTSGAGKDIK